MTGRSVQNQPHNEENAIYAYHSKYHTNKSMITYYLNKRNIKKNIITHNTRDIIYSDSQGSNFDIIFIVSCTEDKAIKVYIFFPLTEVTKIRKLYYLEKKL